MAATTYYAGRLATVKRLNNLSGTWTDVSVTPSIPTYNRILNDVKTNPANPTHVFVGGLSATMTGLFTSHTSGATWIQPGGTVSTKALDVYEVWPIDSLNIVAACSDGYVAKSVDDGLTFDFLSRIPVHSIVPNGNTNYRPNISIHFITPLVGIVGTISRVWKTTDGGSTWFQPTGGNFVESLGILPKQIRGIHMSANQQVITLVSQSGHIFRSTNAGLTYTIAYTFLDNQEGFHLTWLNDNEIWATAGNEQRIKSYDGGATWAIISPINMTVGAPSNVAAHFFTSSKGFYSQLSATTGASVQYSVNAGISGTPSDVGFPINAVWTHYVPDCYKLTNCDDEDDFIIVNNDLTNYVGKVIKVCPEDLPSTTQPNGGEPMVIVINDPNTSIFTLTNCCNPSIKKLVTKELTAYDGKTVIIPSLGTNTCWSVVKGTTPGVENLGAINLTGGVFFDICSSCTDVNPCTTNVPVLETCKCYEVTVAPNCESAFPLLNLSPIFEDCDYCRTCYLLTDCQDPNNTKIVRNDLSGYEGLVIKIEGCPDTCWEVSLAPNCIGGETIENFVDLYATCEECLPPIILPTPPDNIRQRQVAPGYTTKVCTPEYVEKVSCRYADQLYNIMKVKRYGIATCCEEELEKWTIKKELLDLDMLNDPNPPKPLCYCYTITQNSGINKFKYIDCTGNCQIIDLGVESISVCAMYSPIVICPTDNLDFTIVKSDIECTTNADCVPPPAPPCYCYRIDGPDFVYKYVNCDGETIFGHSLNVVFICAQKDSLQILIGDPTIDTDEELCTSDEDCQPVVCYCYNLTANGISSSFNWIDCLGQPQSSGSFKAGTIYKCAREGSVTTDTGAIVNTGNLCNSDSQCEPLPCNCYRIDVVGSGVTTLLYAECGQSPTTHPILNSDTVYVCVQGAAPVKQGGNGTVTVTPLGSNCTTDNDCTPPPPCNCYSVSVTGANVTVSYLGCDNTPTSETFAPGYYLICTPDENSISRTGIGDALILPQDTLCGDCSIECSCYTFAVNGLTSFPITYSECNTGLYFTINVSPGQVLSLCSRTEPFAVNPGDNINPVITGPCTNDCPPITGCINYFVVNTSTSSSITINYIDCLGAPSSQLLGIGQSTNICSSIYPTTTSIPDTEISYISSCP